MCSMANYQKTRTLKRELGQLDQQEKDYMENLANSLLKLQNADFPQTNEKGKKKNEEKALSGFMQSPNLKEVL